MNFFDYELTRTAASTPPQTTSNESEISLNEEVSQVVGQLGKLWGGFRKQSQVALETARKDLASVVVQAQKEFDKLTRDPTEASSAEASNQEPVAGPSSSHEQALRTDFDPPEAQILEKSSDDFDSSPGPGPEPSPSRQLPSQATPTPFQAFFSRMQSSLPPNLNNLSETFERTLPTALKDSAGHLHVPSAADLAQLRSEFGARMQDVLVRTQAEQYVQRSESLLREASEYLREAVKVVPPEEDSSNDRGEADVVFDGMGVGVVVMPPKMVNENHVSVKAKGKGKETAAQARVISRASVLLARLRQDPEVLQQDPAEDEEDRDMYEEWLRDEVTAKVGGIDSSYLSERINISMKEAGEQLTSTRNALVPSVMDSNTFWTRYFFRVYQIGENEEKRKLLLAASGSSKNEEFVWEDDEDEEDSGSSSISHSGETETESRSPAKSQPGTALSNDNDGKDWEKQRPARASPEAPRSQIQSSYPSSLVTSSSNASPRDSSDGYDVISTTSVVDTKAKAIDDADKIEESNRAKKDEAEDMKEDEDSDWE